jgi:hypothetical protein
VITRNTPRCLATDGRLPTRQDANSLTPSPDSAGDGAATAAFLQSAYPDREEDARDVLTVAEGELSTVGWDRVDGEGW